jgi:hypothetical protein
MTIISPNGAYERVGLNRINLGVHTLSGLTHSAQPATTSRERHRHDRFPARHWVQLRTLAMMLLMVTGVARSPGVMADIPWQWTFGATTYPTKAQAVAAMHAADPRYSVLTQELPIQVMNNSAAEYQYVAPPSLQLRHPGSITDTVRPKEVRVPSVVRRMRLPAWNTDFISTNVVRALRPQRTIGPPRTTRAIHRRQNTIRSRIPSTIRTPRPLPVSQPPLRSLPQSRAHDP